MMFDPERILRYMELHSVNHKHMFISIKKHITLGQEIDVHRLGFHFIRAPWMGAHAGMVIEKWVMHLLLHVPILL